jgi:hypothetical protein
MEKPKQVRLLKPSGHACMILSHMLRGHSLTTMQSFRLFGCTSLHSRLSEIRARGWNVRSRELKLKSGRKVLQYSIHHKRSVPQSGPLEER